MKNIKLTSWILASSVFLVFSACQKDDAIVPGMDATELTVSGYQLEDLDGLENPEVTAATENAEFKIRDTDRNRNTANSLAAILKNLNLSENQRATIKEFVEQQSSCVAEHRNKVQQHHQELMQKANAKREDYVRAYRAGRISKAELEEKLSSLRTRLQESLNKDEQKQVRIRIMRKCRAELMANIQTVLNREQLQKWNRWKRNQQ